MQTSRIMENKYHTFIIKLECYFNNGYRRVATISTSKYHCTNLNKQ